ncbi:hypothetical protein JG688_00010878 [Phytophthora aleatoria]|uniref:Uncharacterized protein n=1 Tax=Phytophthora aleatoria TaxID=2496075 RepID=A0A8J5IP27_9STRA|nr:hypothetical protein JG688_00010878 [Phytophthora aleatoria]
MLITACARKTSALVMALGLVNEINAANPDYSCSVSMMMMRHHGPVGADPAATSGLDTASHSPSRLARLFHGAQLHFSKTGKQEVVGTATATLGNVVFVSRGQHFRRKSFLASLQHKFDDHGEAGQGIWLQ